MAAEDAIPSLFSLRNGARLRRKASPAQETFPQLAFELSPDPLPAVADAQPAMEMTLAISPPRSIPEASRLALEAAPPVPEAAPPVPEAAPPVPEAPPSAAGPPLFTVRQLIAELRQHIEGSYSRLLYVEGEVSNCRPASSGHLYFTLKDGDAQLPVVLFRRHAQLLEFKPRDGLAVEVRGRISVYETRGQLQLIAESLRPRGTGALQHAFEQLRDRLRREGLFDRPRTPLPAFPHCVGIITSPNGAAIRDIVHVVRRRHARLNLLIFPAVMQGTQCAASVASGIRWFNRHPERVDLVLIARGGGSLEDLAGFNEESLARSIVNSALPVVSAIGHEIDTTIADYVADLRAPTPSAAAELITAAQHRIEERVRTMERRVLRSGEYHLLRARQRLHRLSAEYVLSRLRDSIAGREQRVDELRSRVEMAVARRQRSAAARLTAIEGRLIRQDPGVLLANSARRLDRTTARLSRFAGELTVRENARLERLHARLQALSPLAVLNRGYAIVYAENSGGTETIVRDASAVAPNTTLRARLARGSVRSTVIQTLLNEGKDHV